MIARTQAYCARQRHSRAVSKACSYTHQHPATPSGRHSQLIKFPPENTMTDKPRLCPPQMLQAVTSSTETADVQPLRALYQGAMLGIRLQHLGDVAASRLLLSEAPSAAASQCKADDLMPPSYHPQSSTLQTYPIPALHAAPPPYQAVLLDSQQHQGMQLVTTCSCATTCAMQGRAGGTLFKH